MTCERFLIVNADDLGLSRGVNGGIAEGHERGIVTSASLMVCQSAAEDGADLAGHLPGLAIGLHLDLDGWDYERGERRTVAPATEEAAVAKECRDQLDAFRAMLGRDPTHLDSHHHLHMAEPLASVAIRIARELKIPLRGKGEVRYEGSFYGLGLDGRPLPRRIDAEHLVELIETLPAGWTEIGCHPGRGAETLSSYGAQREREIDALCDERVKAAVRRAGVRLGSFADAPAQLR